MLILPLAWLAATLSRRTSSAVIALMLAVATLIIPFTPALDYLLPTRQVQIPQLEATGAFSAEVPDFMEFEHRNPLPGQPEDLTLENNPGKTAASIVMMIWGVGALLFAAVRLWHMLKIKLRFAKATPLPPDHPVSRIVQDSATAMGMNNAPLVWISASIRHVQTAGTIHPAIMAPASFEAMDSAQQSMILHHELAHIKRGDVSMRLLLEGVMILFWFHPLTWLILRRCDQETEKACDDAVLHHGHTASAFAETLLVTAKQAGTKGAVGAVRKRIASIINPKKQRLPLTARSTVGFTLLFLLLLLPPALVSFTPYPSTPAFVPESGNSDLRGLWKMALNRGTILPDWSGNNRHGKIYGAQWITDPEKGACLSFDGIDDHLVLHAPEAEWTAEPFTFCIWLKPDMGSDGGGLLLKGDRNLLWSEAMGEFTTEGIRPIFGEKEIFLGGGNYAEDEVHNRHNGLHPSLNYYNQALHRSATSLAPGQWTHVALVWEPVTDGFVSKLYLNGNPVEMTQLITMYQNNISDWPAHVLYFGHGESSVTKNNHYEGLASDLAIYQKALSLDEVKKVMNGDFSFTE